MSVCLSVHVFAHQYVLSSVCQSLVEITGVRFKGYTITNLTIDLKFCVKSVTEARHI